MCGFEMRSGDEDDLTGKFIGVFCKRDIVKSVGDPDGAAVVADHPDFEELEEVGSLLLSVGNHCRRDMALSWNTLQPYSLDPEALVMGNDA